MTNTRKRASKAYQPPIVLIGLVLVLALSGRPVSADPQHDMLLFLSAEGRNTVSTSDPALEGFDDHLAADFLYTFNSKRFRFLAEYLLSDTESELERFQAAWQFDERTMLWFGRFHSITNFWASEYHHGQYMQTSISRPGIEEWEDESGPMPSHITGLLLEHEFVRNNRSVVNFGLSSAYAPSFVGQRLVPFDILDPGSDHELAASARLAYRPDILSTNQIGLALAYNNIVVDSASNPNLVDLNSIRQATLGIFADWSLNDWRFLANFVYFEMDLRYGAGTVQDSFVLGYVQADYAIRDEWTVFGRAEFGFNEDDSAYLQLLPAVIAHRLMLGVRWDFASSHAITLEVADTSTNGDGFTHDNFKQLRIQWSAVFP